MPLTRQSIGDKTRLPAYQSESAWLTGGAPDAVLVAVGVNGMRSLNGGLTWTAITQPGGTWRGVTYIPARKRFFAGGDNGVDRIASAAADGRTFTAIPGSGNQATYSAIAANDDASIIVAVSDSVASVNQFLRSTDGGDTWTPIPAPAARAWLGIIWDSFNSQFVASNTTLLSGIATSPDGLAWTLQATPGGVRAYSVAQSDTTGRMLTVDGGGGTASYSDDGVTWNPVIIAGVSMYQSAANGSIWATMFPGTLAGPYRSTDNAVTWVTPAVLPVNNNFQAMCYAPQVRRFIAVARAGGAGPATQRAIYSADDALTYQIGTTPAGDYYSVCEGGG